MTTKTIQSAANDHQHYDKLVEPDEIIKLQSSRLKWYNLAKADEPVLPEIRDLARSFLEKEAADGNLKDFGELGFIILHRCGADFYFLLVNSWRNGNELWESVYAKQNAEQTDFQPFTFKICIAPHFASGNSPPFGTSNRRGNAFFYRQKTLRQNKFIFKTVITEKRKIIEKRK